MTKVNITNKLWNLCHVLRDDGIVYHKYLSELTYLLFLKIAQETNTEGFLPTGCRWSDLLDNSGHGMLSFYRKMLTTLGEDSPDEIVRKIFAFPTTVFAHDENLQKVVHSIDHIDWHIAKTDGLGNLYESLLERNAAEARSGAGQYFTPRSLVDCLVRLLKPSLGEVIQDPAIGTGGFLISADHYIRQQNSDSDYATLPPTYQGVEIASDTYRLCLMNFFLHGMNGKIVHGDTLTNDAALNPADVIIANPPFGSSAGSARARRSDLPFPTSNKQLLFLQHIYLGLKEGGRAAVVVPDNVLFEEGVGRRVRSVLLETCDLHTILRLPTGIFYAAGVNTNVLMFTRNPTNDTGTEFVWVYDLRTDMPRFRKGHPITQDNFRDFEIAFGDDPRGQAKRVDHGPGGRFRCFSRAEIAKRGDNLDIRWLRDRQEGPEQMLEEPELITAGIIDTLRTALLEIEALASEFERIDR